MIERRRKARHPIFESARIVFNYRHVRGCTVRNFSDDGACLEPASTAGIPETFDLLRHRQARTCQVIWRTLDCLGVCFVSFE